MYRQVKSPKLDSRSLYVTISGQAGTSFNCEWDWSPHPLSVVLVAYGGVDRLVRDLEVEWENESTRHLGLIPEDVYIPIYWMNESGKMHVAICKRTEGTLIVFSAPTTPKPAFYSVQGKVDNVLRIVGELYLGDTATYAGWSERICGITAVEKEAPAPKHDPIELDRKNGRARVKTKYLNVRPAPHLDCKPIAQIQLDEVISYTHICTANGYHWASWISPESNERRYIALEKIDGPKFCSKSKKKTCVNV